MAPELTVVVVPFAGPDYLVHCLTALTSQMGRLDSQIVVAHDRRLGDVSAFRSTFPGVEFLGVDGERTPAELRALGVRNARGRIVALTEDHCTPDPDWSVRILDAHAGPSVAIGGAVECSAKQTDSSCSWAVYLCDWGRYMNPLREGPARSLTDCNVSYKRQALMAISNVWSREFHEPVVHAALQARGASLWLSPQIIVRQKRSLRLGEAIRDRYSFGRLFGATRVPREARAKRAFLAGASFLLPVLLITRVATHVIRKRRHRMVLARVFPSLTLLTMAWAVGELTGYVAGAPDASQLVSSPRSTRDAQLAAGVARRFAWESTPTVHADTAGAFQQAAG